MRLTDEERRTIRGAVKEVFGPTAVVRLFGSRVHDHLRGGDIDLHVELKGDHPDANLQRLRLWGLLQDRLGEQKIDLVVTMSGSVRQPIDAIAYRDGVLV